MRTSLARTLVAAGILAMSSVACSSHIPTEPSDPPPDQVPANVLATLRFAPDTLYLQAGHEDGIAELIAADSDGTRIPLKGVRFTASPATFLQMGKYPHSSFVLDDSDSNNVKVTPLFPGTGTVEAEMDGVRANLVVRVRMLHVSPQAMCAKPHVKSDLPLKTFPYDYDGNLLPDTAKVEWASQDTTVVTVDENGMVSYHNPGATYITATQYGMTQAIYAGVDPKLDCPDIQPSASKMRR